MPTDPEPTPTDPRQPPSEEFFSNWWLVSDGGGPLVVMPDFGRCIKKYPKAPLRATPPKLRGTFVFEVRHPWHARSDHVLHSPPPLPSLESQSEHDCRQEAPTKTQRVAFKVPPDEYSPSPTAAAEEQQDLPSSAWEASAWENQGDQEKPDQAEPAPCEEQEEEAPDLPEERPEIVSPTSPADGMIPEEEKAAQTKPDTDIKDGGKAGNAEGDTPKAKGKGRDSPDTKGKAAPKGKHELDSKGKSKDDFKGMKGQGKEDFQKGKDDFKGKAAPKGKGKETDYEEDKGKGKPGFEFDSKGKGKAMDDFQKGKDGGKEMGKVDFQKGKGKDDFQKGKDDFQKGKGKDDFQKGKDDLQKGKDDFKGKSKAKGTDDFKGKSKAKGTDHEESEGGKGKDGGKGKASWHDVEDFEPGEEDDDDEWGEWGQSDQKSDLNDNDHGCCSFLIYLKVPVIDVHGHVSLSRFLLQPGSSSAVGLGALWRSCPVPMAENSAF